MVTISHPLHRKKKAGGPAHALVVAAFKQSASYLSEDFRRSLLRACADGSRQTAYGTRHTGPNKNKLDIDLFMQPRGAHLKPPHKQSCSSIVRENANTTDAVVQQWNKRSRHDFAKTPPAGPTNEPASFSSHCPSREKRCTTQPTSWLDGNITTSTEPLAATPSNPRQARRS